MLIPLALCMRNRGIPEKASDLYVVCGAVRTGSMALPSRLCRDACTRDSALAMDVASSTIQLCNGSFPVSTPTPQLPHFCS